MTPSIHFLAGGNALGHFRARQLLPKLQAVHPKIKGLSARFVHVVHADAGLPAPALAQLAALLDYGEPVEGAEDGVLVVVTPRLGTVSPWASKATDIAHNCGLAVHRIERITEYRISLATRLLGKAPVLEPGQLQALANLLHDRMTESAMFERA